MSNKKVYLAKNILASGFDVEYVKSSLSRIPGIDIIEAGMGIKPSECASFVIVADDGVTLLDNEDLALSKNVAKDLKEFLKNSEEDFPRECVYIYSHQDTISGHIDVEETFPRCLTMIEDNIETVDKENYDHYADILVEDEEVNLLEYVSTDINVPCSAHRSVPLHYQPKPQYAIPPAPSFEERRVGRTVTSNTNVFDTDALQHRIDEINGDRRRLLLLRRK